MIADIPSRLLPKLRFPEFRDAGKWEESKARSLFVNRVTKGEEGLPIYSVTMHDGMVRRDSLDRNYYDIEEPAGNKKALKNDIVYNMMRMWQGALGVAPEDCLVSPAYIVLTPQKHVVSQFFQLLFKLPSSKLLLTSYSRGLTKDRLRLYYDDFARIPLSHPSEPEQQRIADCIGSLDDLIASEGRKLDTLQQHKLGVMQHLFPPHGDTVPRFRFPEFQNAEEWKLRKLGDLVHFESGGTPFKGNPTFWNGSVPWVSAKDMKQLFLEDTEDHISIAAIDEGARLVPAGTLLVLTRGMTLRKDVPVCVLRREMSFNQDVKALRPKAGENGLFVAFAMLANKPRLLEMVDIAGHGTGKLNTYELEAFEFACPKPAEQKQVAAFLLSLDEMLAVHSQKLKALMIHKRGLLQQLFPSRERSKQ